MPRTVRQPSMIAEVPAGDKPTPLAVGESSDGPPELSERQRRLADFLLRALSPRLKKVELSEPPPELAPFESLEIERSTVCGRLAATWYPALGEARGAVLLVHPWVPWGQGYFHRRGRLPALRTAGYHALTFDLAGVGRSGRPAGDFHTGDLEAVVEALAGRSGGLPLFLWGVSAGGYWSHFLLSRRSGIRGAVFEDVSNHLIRWSRRMAPWGLPAYLFFEHGLAHAYRFLDLRRHAPRLRVKTAAYVSGRSDAGVLPEETAELARLAGAECLLVQGADHLEPIKVAEAAILELALDTFEGADRLAGRQRPTIEPPDVRSARSPTGYARAHAAETSASGVRLDDRVVGRDQHPGHAEPGGGGRAARTVSRDGRLGL